MLRASHKSTRHTAVGALTRFVSSTDELVALVNLNVVGQLLEFSMSDDAQVRRDSLAVLAGLIQIDGGRGDLVSMNGVQTLVSVAERGMESPFQNEQADLEEALLACQLLYTLGISYTPMSRPCHT